MIRHHAFIEELACRSDRSPEWEVLMAGYLVIGLLDAWHRLDPMDLIGDHNIENIGRRIEMLPSRYAAEQATLRDVLQNLVQIPSMARPSHVAKSVLAYAMVLEQELRWGPASDVYATIAEAIEGDARGIAIDFSAAGYARRREGLCFRNMAKYDRAKHAYIRAIKHGHKGHDDDVRLHAQIGLANMKRVRGDFLGAAEIINEISRDLNDCTHDVRMAVQSNFLHLRSGVKQDLKEYETAVHDLKGAYKTAPDQYRKELILMDIGLCIGNVGLQESGEAILNKVALTATSHLARQGAVVNLINLRLEANDRTAFMHWRDAWNPEHCDLTMRTAGLFYIGAGLKRFGNRREALTTLSDAIDLAVTHGLEKLKRDIIHEIESF